MKICRRSAEKKAPNQTLPCTLHSPDALENAEKIIAHAQAASIPAIPHPEGHPRSRKDLVSSLQGAVAGLVSLGFLLPLEAAYPAYGLSVLLTTPITWAFAKEDVLEPSRARPYLKEEVLQAYYISPTSHGDFFWVFCSRTGYYMAVSTQIYILYYLRDCMTDPQISSNAKTYTAMLCIISQGCSGIVSLVAGHMTARFGYKPLIYGACVVMASVYIGYTLVHSFAYVVALGIVYGSSNGVYLAADYALAVDCLPNKDDGAKDLALWGIAAFREFHSQLPAIKMFPPCQRLNPLIAPTTWALSSSLFPSSISSPLSHILITITTYSLSWLCPCDCIVSTP